MARQLAHRGPDDEGVWLDTSLGVALAHRRLSILDLSPAGHQPMTSPGGRYVIVFNGEIYNHLALRKALEQSANAPAWRGHADTETLLAAFEVWGIENTLKKTVGMFALALWDRKGQTLTLARDRMGEKPLYYGWQQGCFLFASELKGLRRHPDFQGRVDRNALALFLRHNYVPAPYSIYEGIHKLLPGTYLTLSVDTLPGVLPEPAYYWRLRDAASQPLREDLCDADAVTGLDTLLRQAVQGQMLADVPLGAFLSGGVDSSTVVALMQAQSTRPVRTFTMGFHETGYNEAEHAHAVAKRLGCEHTELYVTPGQALGVIPQLPELYDEPFADPSQIPTFLVAKLARQQVTVSLSGDGGDELFGGYNRHSWAAALWRRMRHLPLGARQAAALAMTSISPAAWNRILGVMAPVLPNRFRQAVPGDKLHKAAKLFAASRPEDIYLRLVSHWNEPARVVLGAQEPPTAITCPEHWLKAPDLESRMMYMDAISYLPDDILVKVDRAAMGVSLETRAPFLDHRLIEFAWRLPLSMKIRNGQGKWLLRQVLYQYVPQTLIERPKMGFGIPLDSWLRGSLRNWGEALLAEERLQREGFFDPAPIRKTWAEHLSGRRNQAYCLWNVLMFQAWLEQQYA